MTPEAIQRSVLETITNSSRRMTPNQLVRAVAVALEIAPRVVRAEIETLVRAMELVYRYEFGASFIERSFERPVRLGRKVVVTPPPGPRVESAHDVVIKIAPGAAFGTGRHATTRLCIQGLEHVARTDAMRSKDVPGTLLDIGTGSGILLITAAKLGMGSGLGIDTDPCARAEARVNVGLNQLQDVLEIAATPLEQVHTRFGLVMANLRFPTLKRLAPWFKERCYTEGQLVVSGLKSNEWVAFKQQLERNGFRLIWHATELDWAAGVFIQ